jgi:hypothetical protein
MTPGHGLTNLGDRLAALGGSLTIDSSPGNGTRVRGSVPVELEPGGPGSDPGGEATSSPTPAGGAPRSRSGPALESAASTPGG